MNSARIKEIQKETPYPESHSVMVALDKVWNETVQDISKDISTSYEGCHTEVAAKLMRGEHIKCQTFNKLGTTSGIHTVVAYVHGRQNPYTCTGLVCHSVKPILPTKYRLLSPTRLMSELLVRGYEVSQKGIWSCGNDRMPVDAWQYCGKIVDKECWEDWQLQEVQCEY